jgi:hypothetical protein
MNPRPRREHRVEKETLDLEGMIPHVIEQLESLVAQYGTTAEICECNDYDNSTYLAVFVMEPETDTQYQNRCVEEDRRAARDEAWDRKQLAMLTAKYKPEEPV